MVANWVAPAVTTTYSVLSLIGTAVTAVFCPPMLPVVGAGFAVGSKAIDAGLGAAAGADKEKQQQMFMNDLRNSFAGINGTLYENQELLIKNKELILQHQEMLADIQTMLDSNAEENRQMMRGLHVSIEKFESNMKHSFNELKEFMIEKDFIRDTVEKIDLVWDGMNRAIEIQEQFEMDEFKKTYLANTPRNILLMFASGLKRPLSNPVVSSMETNVLRSRNILNSYNLIFAHLIVKVVAVEGFYYGLSDAPKNATAKFMEGINRTVAAAIFEFRKHATLYEMKEELYWPSVVNETINENLDHSNLAILTDSISQKLEGIHTTDVFSIYAYRCSNHQDLANYDCKPWPLMNFDFPTVNTETPRIRERMKSFMVSTSKGNLHVVVLRSKKFREIPPSAVMNVQAHFGTYSMTMAPLNEGNTIDSMKAEIGHDKLLETIDVSFKPNPNLVNGFVAFGDINPEVRFTNNGTSILAHGNGYLPHKYYGLNWI